MATQIEPLLLPFDATESRRDEIRALTSAASARLHFQLCLSELWRLEEALELTSGKVQIWIHRDLSAEEQDRIRRFVRRIELVIISSRRVDMRKLTAAPFFRDLQEVMIYMSPQKIPFMPCLNAIEAYAQILGLRRRLPGTRITSLAVANVFPTLSTATRAFWRNPLGPNFYELLRERGRAQVLYFKLRGFWGKHGRVHDA